jgi:hypothetical protein
MIPLTKKIPSRTGKILLSGRTPARPKKNRKRIGIIAHLNMVHVRTMVITHLLVVPSRVSSTEQATNENDYTPKSKECAGNTDGDHAAWATIFFIFINGRPNNKHKKRNP